jgi:hypothetical protein
MFGDAFGMTPLGPRFQWMQGADNRLFYFLDNGMKEIRLDSGLLIMQRQYQRKTWADRIGPNTWVVASWTAPEMSFETWDSMFHGAVQYPDKGRFCPIPNSKMEPGDEPDEDITLLAIETIRRQLNKTYSQIHAECLAAGEAAAAEPRKQWSDFVDSIWPAFDGVPGKKLNTSFPSVPKKEVTLASS